MNLHIVSFDVPYPPNYGGIVDIYNKIRILNKLGCKIILHLYYKDEPAKIRIDHLQEYCSKIFLYRRKSSFSIHFSLIPYIVRSRSSKELLLNLQADNFPILFEGLHTCYFLAHKELRDRKKIVRMHNIEWQYYNSLIRSETNIFKRLFFSVESLKLNFFEKVISNAQDILAISPQDYKYLIHKYTVSNIKYLPPFHFTDAHRQKSIRGDNILFHGDLSINDTEHVLLKLIDVVLSKLQIPIKIAGKNPGIRLTKAISSCSNIELIANPNDFEMQSLIENAHIILVYSGIKAGMKLKLLNGLFQGRFIVGDDNSINGTGIEELCYIENNYLALTALLKELWVKEYSEKINRDRTDVLDENFSNIANGNKLLKIIQTK